MSVQNTIEIKVDPNTIVDSLGNEIGILSVQTVMLKHQMKALSDYAANLAEQNAALLERVTSQDKTIGEMRAELIKREPNHPGNRVKKH